MPWFWFSIKSTEGRASRANQNQRDKHSRNSGKNLPCKLFLSPTPQLSRNNSLEFYFRKEHLVPSISNCPTPTSTRMKETATSILKPFFLSALCCTLLLGNASLFAKNKEPGEGKAGNADSKQAAKESKKDEKEHEKEAKLATKEKKKDSKEETKDEKLEKRKESKEEKLKAQKEANDKKLEDRDKRVDALVEKREERQTRRIEDGIQHGNLTPSELSNLRARQSSIEELHKSLRADGKLTADEAKKLRGQLDACSAAIFAEKHDTEGKAKAIRAHGHSIALKKEVADRLSGAEMNRVDARTFLSDLHKMVTFKRQLSEETMGPEARSKLQDDYNQLLNQYFVSKNQ